MFFRFRRRKADNKSCFHFIVSVIMRLHQFPVTSLIKHFSPLCFQSKSILERHLVIADQVYTMNDLVQSTKQLGDSNEKILLPSYRDALNIRVTEEIGRKCFKVFFYKLFFCGIFWYLCLWFKTMLMF